MTYASFVLPAGFYFIGDPCFVVEDHDLWLEFLKDTFFTSHKEEAKGFTIWVASTTYGDGVYFDSDGYSYPVDSGTIGIVSMEDVKQMASEETLEELKNNFENDEKDSSLGRVVKFEEDFEVFFNGEDPTHVFGSIEIFTDNEEEYLDDLYLDEEYDDGDEDEGE